MHAFSVLWRKRHKPGKSLGWQLLARQSRSLDVGRISTMYIMPIGFEQTNAGSY